MQYQIICSKIQAAIHDKVPGAKIIQINGTCGVNDLGISYIIDPTAKSYAEQRNATIVFDFKFQRFPGAIVSSVEDEFAPFYFRWNSVGSYKPRILRYLCKKSNDKKTEEFILKVVNIISSEIASRRNKIKERKVKLVENQLKAMTATGISEEVFGENILKESTDHSLFYQMRRSSMRSKKRDIFQLHIVHKESEETPFAVSLVGMYLNEDQLKDLMEFMKRSNMVVRGS